MKIAKYMKPSERILELAQTNPIINAVLSYYNYATDSTDGVDVYIAILEKIVEALDETNKNLLDRLVKIEMRRPPKYIRTVFDKDAWDKDQEELDNKMQEFLEDLKRWRENPGSICMLCSEPIVLGEDIVSWPGDQDETVAHIRCKK